MSTFAPTDADWASLPRRFWLAMLSLRRERDDAVQYRTHLQRDYDAVCAELERAQEADEKRDVKFGSLEEETYIARAQVRTLLTLLQGARKEKDESLREARVKIRSLRDEKTKIQNECEEVEKTMREMRSTMRERSCKEFAYRRFINLRMRMLERMLEDADVGVHATRAERDEAVAAVAAKDVEIDALRVKLEEARRGLTSEMYDVDIASDEETVARMLQD